MKNKALLTITATVTSIFILAGCTTTVKTSPVESTNPGVTSVAPSEAPTAPSEVAADENQSSTANLLETLPVDDSQAAGYDRSLFNHWVSQGNGCDTRDVVLAREVIDGKVNGCEVTGTWVSIYDNVTVTNPGELDIDHMVPLKEAWVSGASTWDSATREAYANDLDGPYSLIAVTASSNRSKSDQDPTTWKPSNLDACEYVARWVSVKHRWNLAVDTSEKSAILSVLSWCDGDYTLPSVPTMPVVTDDTQEPVTEPVVDPVASDGNVDPQFSTCKEVKANGYGPYVKGTNPEYEWYQDRDGDGSVCE